jgi:hypothetical protein
MFFYLLLCRKDKYFRFQIRSNGCKIVKICKIPPQNMRGAKPLNFPTAPLQLLYHLTSCRPLNSSSRSRAVPLEHLFGQLHTYLLHRKSSRLPKHKTHCPKSRFCFLAVQVDPFSAIPRRFSAPPLKRDRYLILSRSSYISPGNYILFTAITPLCTDNGGVVGSGGGGCAIISKFRTFFVRNFDERNDVQELQVGPGDKWFADSPNWLNWRPYGARWAKRSDHHNAQLSRAHLNANPTE